MKNLPKKFENDDFQANLQGEFKAKIQPKFELKFSEFKAPDDYKFHCFGKSREIYIQVDTDRFLQHTRTMFDSKWQELNFTLCFPKPSHAPSKPRNLELMLLVARLLAADFEGVRVDLFEIFSRVAVGELTFTHGGGTEKFEPSEWDGKFGDLW